jgi:glycogen synthase
VLVLGARRGGPGTRAWDRADGFALQVVPVPAAQVPRRERRAERRVARLEARRARIGRRVDELRERAASDQSTALRHRLLSRLSRRRYAHATESAKRAREQAKQLKATGKESRDLGDPHDLARYEAAWWPLVRRLRPDIVHACDVSGLSTASRAGRRGARWIYDAHEPKRHGGEEGWDAARRRQVAEHASHADAVIATTAPLAEVLVSDLALPRAPALVHNTPSLRAGPAPRPGLREAAGVSADDPLLVYTGVLTRHRRLDVVVEAMTMLAEVRLALVVGSGDPLTRELLARAAELGVSERVHVIAKVPPESVVPFVAEADVGVFPLARYPGGDMALPNKLFEYLHAGLPMVVSDSPAMADFVRRYGLGESVPVDDAPGWAQAIERALAPPFYRERVSDWEALKKEWCWERQAERLVGVYRELLSSPPLMPSD